MAWIRLDDGSKQSQFREKARDESMIRRNVCAMGE
jgi:hypothetical protein